MTTPVTPTAPPTPPTAAPAIAIGAKLLSELPALFQLALSAQGVPAALGPVPHTASKWAGALGFLPGSIVAQAAADYDQLHGAAHVTVDEVIGLLGIDPKGVIGQAVAIGEVLAS